MLDYLNDPSVFDYSDGFIDLATSPGLGIEIDEEYVRKRARENVDWHNLV